MKVTYLGKTVDTKHFDGNVDKDVVNYIRDNFYNEDKDKALENINKVLTLHQSKVNHIYNYYFERIANDTLVDSSKWTINQALQSDELIQIMYNKTLNNPKIFRKGNYVSNFKKAIHLGGKGYFKKATQFPIKVMRELLDEFTQEGDVYYDPCCGWGIRMLVSAEKGLTYIGNDVNMDLVAKLNEFGGDINTLKPFKYAILPQGSEIHIPKLDNKVDFIFTSPPYFDLEIYKNSEKLNTISYQEWLDTFIKPMLLNCKSYIKVGKYIAINIKNSSKYMLYDDTRDIGEGIGLTFVGERELKQSNRTHTTKTHGDSSEKIMVFRKDS